MQWKQVWKLKLPHGKTVIVPTIPTQPSKKWTEHQHLKTWKNMPGCRHSKLFISRMCKKRADDLLKLNRHQIKSAVAFLTGHAPVRWHLRIIGLFNEDPSCRFCRMETEMAQQIICSSEALSRQRYYIFGKPLVEPREISTASVRDPCLFIRVSGLLNLCWNTQLGLHNKP
jgi:hypothetical protein